MMKNGKIKTLLNPPKPIDFFPGKHYNIYRTKREERIKMTEDKMMEAYEDELYGMYEMMDAAYEEYVAERDYEM